jgi:hypothetical protein
MPEQRLRVRVPSFPPFILKQLVNGVSTQACPNRPHIFHWTLPVLNPAASRNFS